MKKTNQWLLRYSQPSLKSHDFKLFPSTTTNVRAGTHPTLLKNRTLIQRHADKSKGEEDMPIPMIHTVELEINGKSNRYVCLYLDEPKQGFTEKDFEADQWAKLQRDVSILKLAKEHLQVSVVINGKETNSNFYVEDQPYYILTNLDAQQDMSAEHDQKVKKLGYELSLTYQAQDKSEFTNLCYLMGINPTNLSLSELYNILSVKIEQDPDGYEKVVLNPDRWIRIVLNKALRTGRPNTTPPENYIHEITDGQFANYYQSGKHIATGYDSLVGYFKDNGELFTTLEIDLGLKKKEQQPTGSVTGTSSSEQPTLKNKPGPKPKQPEGTAAQ